MDLRYDDNINNSVENPIDSFLLLTNPRVAVEYDRNAVIYSLEYSLSHGNYLDGGRASFTDHALTADAEWEISNRQSLTFGAAYLDIHEEFNDQVANDLESLIYERDRYRESNLFATYSYGAEGARGHLDLTLGVTDRNYIEELIASDRRTPYGGAALSVNIGGKTALLAQLDVRSIHYDQGISAITERDNREASLMIGGERETSQFTALLLAGIVRKYFDNNDIQDYQRPRWIAALDWRPTETSELTLSAERRPVDSVDTLANFVDATSGLVGWQHAWSEKISSNAYFRYTEADFTGTDVQQKSRRWGLTVRYQFRPWMDIRSGISALNQQANEEDLTYDRNQVFLGFDASY
ncbi:outer membrane beta-barrel protein [Microbulbifer bruguierae]|uniref:Outer membrane beta-barrel protein n=2 Tax=Microbulbifer bruguierae TaxID=3029061 RepID=A0ABY8NH26_9GAMM|nr:outer membrane beta-barrel protein [Microbulbifer bruguierae]WGL18236.1 outer membrane beta-barrel protein [Microbulbifer bruguierae]